MNTSETLKFLDERFERLEMPCFSNMNIDYVASRLSVYCASPNEWILLFNSIVWWPAAEGLMGMIEVIGPGVEGRQGFDNDRCTVPGVVETDDSDQTVHSISVRGSHIELAKLDIAPRYEVQPEIGFWACVALLPDYRDMLLASAAEIEPFIPNRFVEVFQTDAWEHPDFGTPPSMTETFGKLPAAVASNNFESLRNCSRPNSSWSHWLPK